MSVTIEIDGAIQLMEDMGERSRDLSPVLDVIAQDLLTFTDDAFEGSRGPAGKAWEPLKDATVKARRRGSSKPLIDTGTLRGSITAVPGALGILVGTNLPYAGVHQFGFDERNIPARPFLPLRLEGDSFEIVTEGPAEEEWERYEEMIATFIETGEILKGPIARRVFHDA